MQCVHSRRIHTSVETQRPRLHAPYQSLQAPTQTSFATPSAARRCTSSTRRSLASFLFGSAAPCSFVSKPSTSSTTRISMHPPEPRPGRSRAPAAVQRPSVPLPLGRSLPLRTRLVPSRAPSSSASSLRNEVLPSPRLRAELFFHPCSKWRFTRLRRARSAAETPASRCSRPVSSTAAS